MLFSYVQGIKNNVPCAALPEHALTDCKPRKLSIVGRVSGSKKSTLFAS